MAESSAHKLRQKAINLLYLIFLAMIFTYISSDFVDAIQKTDQTTTMLCNEVSMQTNRYNTIALSHLKNDSIAYEETKIQLYKIDKASNNAIAIIDSLRMSLIEKEGFNKYGYLNGGKNDAVSTDYMIYGKKAKDLFDKLETYKLDISQFVEADKVDQLDTIMPLPNRIAATDGKLVDLDKFYFDKSPLTISLLNLNSFRSKIELIRSFVVNELVSDAISSSSYAIPAPISRSFVSEASLIGNKDYIQVFQENINWDSVILYDTKEPSKQTVDVEALKKELAKKRKLVSIESLNDSIYAVDHPIRFNFKFDPKSGKSIKIKLTDPNGEDQEYLMTEPGTFLFVPDVKGYYQLRFTNGEFSGRKNIKVIDLSPVLETKNVGTLYIGINNELKLRSSEFEDTEGLQARISSGRILKRGSSFFARVDEEGEVRVEIFAKMPYGFVRVAHKDYVVRKLNPPNASFQNETNGSAIPVSKLASMQRIQVKTDELLVSESYYIAGFEMTIIYNDHTAILKPIRNTGNSLNSTSMEALSKAQAGDIVMFSKIRGKSSLGTDIELQPLTYTITN